MTHSVNVVQCPKCGSPVGAARPDEIMACSYCGSRLEVSVGASGHPIARLANIEASTVYLARAEQIRRAREQMAEKDSEIRNLHLRFEQHRDKAKRNQPSITRWTTVTGFLLSGLIVGTSESVSGFVIPLATVASWVVASLWCYGQLVKLGQEHRDASVLLTAERGRLAARVAELEAGLDELSQRL